MKDVRLQEWELQAIHDAYVDGEKVTSIACEFNITPAHVRVVARRLGAKLRAPRRPKKVGNVKAGCTRL